MTIRSVFGEFPQFVRYCEEAGLNDIKALDEDTIFEYCLFNDRNDQLNALTSLLNRHAAEGAVGEAVKDAAEKLMEKPAEDQTEMPLPVSLHEGGKETPEPAERPYEYVPRSAPPVCEARDEPFFPADEPPEDGNPRGVLPDDVSPDIYVMKSADPSKPFELVRLCRLRDVLKMSRQQQKEAFDCDELALDSLERLCGGTAIPASSARDIPTEAAPMTEQAVGDEDEPLPARPDSLAVLLGIDAEQYRGVSLYPYTYSEKKAQIHLAKLGCESIGDLLLLTREELFSSTYMTVQHSISAVLRTVSGVIGVNIEAGMNGGDPVWSGEPSGAETAEESALPAHETLGDEFGLDAEAYKTMSIRDMKIGTRAASCLMRAKIFTVGSLLTHSREELMRIRNFGDGCLDEITECLKNDL